MAEFPRLTANNAALLELREWLEGQRELLRDRLETEMDRNARLLMQGRVSMVRELLANTDPQSAVRELPKSPHKRAALLRAARAARALKAAPE